jgi:acetylglutamate kinase
VAALRRLGLDIALVHGGGKPIDRAMEAAGLVPKKVAGRRYTDDATLEIVVRVLREINSEIVSRLAQLGVFACGLSSPPNQMALLGDRLSLPTPEGGHVDLGRVGKVVEVNTGLLQRFFDDGWIPVLPSLAVDEHGGFLNVNADTAASAVAGEITADKVIFLTDTPGVLRSRTDTRSLIPKLTTEECRTLIASGVIEGGMVPKVEACFEALDLWSTITAVILDGRVPYSLLDVFLSDTFTGTEITK